METNMKISVFGYKPDINDKSKILYHISVTYEGVSWIVTKRYSEFDDLQKQLKVCFNNQLPELPKKSYTSFLISKTHDDIEIRRQGLDTYIRQLVSKPEIVASIQLKDFLQLEENAKNLILNQPEIIHQFTGFMHGVRDFTLSNDLGVFFIVNSDYSMFNRLDAYLTNMKGPWEKENGQEAKMPVGCVECWISGQNGDYVRQWAKMYNSQAICCFWEPASFVLLIGLDNGSIDYMEVSYNQGFKKCDVTMELSEHSNRVTGLYYDLEQKWIHSVSRDKKYKIRNLTKSIYENEISPVELTDLIVNKQKKQSYISDKNGCIYIFDLDKLQQIKFVNTNVKLLRNLILDYNILFAVGQENGELIQIDINKQFEQIEQFNGKPGSYRLCYSSKRREAYIGNLDGTITFLDVNLNKVICILKAHESEITKMQWISENQQLLTSSRDKEIKLWQLPNNWKNNS